MKVDLMFPASAGTPFPCDHGYALFGALSRSLPQLHDRNGIGVHPISGQAVGGRKMQLTKASHLTIRCDAERIADWLPLAGASLDVAGTEIVLDAPRVKPLIPSSALRSRLVTIKGFMEQDDLLPAIRRQLEALNVSPEAIVALGARRTVRIQQKEVVGYEVLIEGLTAEESLDVQETGIGGRRHMGCGLFLPLR